MNGQIFQETCIMWVFFILLGETPRKKISNSSIIELSYVRCHIFFVVTNDRQQLVFLVCTHCTAKMGNLHTGDLRKLVQLSRSGHRCCCSAEGLL